MDISFQHNLVLKMHLLELERPQARTQKLGLRSSAA